MALWDTAGNIVNDAATELGLQSFQAKSADPFASPDANIGRLCQLLKSVGRDLQRRRDWTHLRQTTSFVTVAGQYQYPLPYDFGRMLEQTGWNRTNRMPMGGPLSPQEWEYLKGQVAGVLFTVLFRPMQGQLWIYPDTNTPGGYTIAFEYVSRGWCVPSGAPDIPLPTWQPATTYSSSVLPNGYIQNGGNVYELGSDGTSASTGTGPSGTGSGIADGTASWNYVCAAAGDSPSASADTVFFDPQLVMRGLKLAFLRAVGMDSTAAEEDFEDAYAQACAEDLPGRILNLGTTTLLRVPLIGAHNIPVTNWGT